MASSLSNLVNNLSQGIHRINVNLDMTIKNVKHVKSNTIIETIFMNIQTLKVI